MQADGKHLKILAMTETCQVWKSKEKTKKNKVVPGGRSMLQAREQKMNKNQRKHSGIGRNRKDYCHSRNCVLGKN